MGALKNEQHDKFCQALIAGKNQKQAAIDAGYKPKYASNCATRIASRTDVIARLEELNGAATSLLIMSVIERKERLSEIARARLSDFMNFADGKPEIVIGSQPLKSAAVESVTTKTVPGKDGSELVTIIHIKLHDPIKAIAELNSMEGNGSWSANVNINQAVVPIKEVVIIKDYGH